jgi:phage repressor protein C with HTH and peptisase S24 domain
MSADHFTDVAAASSWMVRERNKRGWSTTVLAANARAVARREGSTLELTQQSVSGFEQPKRLPKKIPDWFRFVKMAFEEGLQPEQQVVAARDELVFIREVDISYAMGDGAEIEDYPEASLVPFNLNFIQAMSKAPIEQLFLATGHGESMEPTLLRHDLVLVDTSERRVARQDLIWALNYAGAGMIKRLRRVKGPEGDEFLILSDNASVPPQPAAIRDVHIVGKVVWVGRRIQ